MKRKNIRILINQFEQTISDKSEEFCKMWNHANMWLRDITHRTDRAQRDVIEYVRSSRETINKLNDDFLFSKFIDQCQRSKDIEEKLDAIIKHIGINLVKADPYTVEE
jgi:hypothetical protein